jgi:hypothetical protein
MRSCRGGHKEGEVEHDVEGDGDRPHDEGDLRIVEPLLYAIQLIGRPLYGPQGMQDNANSQASPEKRRRPPGVREAANGVHARVSYPLGTLVLVFDQGREEQRRVPRSAKPAATTGKRSCVSRPAGCCYATHPTRCR